jgi:predicted ATPase
MRRDFRGAIGMDLKTSKDKIFSISLSPLSNSAINQLITSLPKKNKFAHFAAELV